MVQLVGIIAIIALAMTWGSLRVQRSFGLRPLLITSVVWIALLVIGFTVLNQPQCPINQVDTSKCIIGVNIGLGWYVLFAIIPSSIALLMIWILAVVRTIRSKARSTA